MYTYIRIHIHIPIPGADWHRVDYIILHYYISPLRTACDDIITCFISGQLPIFKLSGIMVLPQFFKYNMLEYNK